MRPARNSPGWRHRAGSRALATLVAAAVTLGAAGCAPGTVDTPDPDDGPRVLTQSEAERLAVVRFRNFDAGTRAIDLEIPESAGAARLHLVGWYDFAGHRGYARTTEGARGIAVVTGDVAWSPEVVAIAPVQGPATTDVAPDGVPADADWSAAPFDVGTSVLTSALGVIASLGSDRPENANLLRQSDAAHLRTATLGEVPVDVFAGPSGGTAPASSPAPGTEAPGTERITYWVDATGLALRVDIPLHGTTATLLLGVPDATTPPDLRALIGVLGTGVLGEGA